MKKTTNLTKRNIDEPKKTDKIEQDEGKSQENRIEIVKNKHKIE